MLSGAVHVIALADGFSEIEELIETNNERVGPLMGIGWAPDLVVRSLSGPPSALTGAPFGVAVEVCNQGTEPSDPTLARVYHSADAVLTGIGGPLAGDDWYAGQLEVPALNPGVCAPVEGSVTATPFEQGAYHLGATVDEPSAIDELIETNNAHVGPLMGVGSGPDLVVTRIEGPPTSGFGSLTLDFEVCNQGTAASPPAQVSFYDSEDTVIEPDEGPPYPGSDRWLGAETYPGLAAGDCHSGEAQVWLAPGVEGERRLGAVADEWNGVDELVEANNVFVGPVIGIGFGPDLVLTQLLAPPSVENGEFLELDTQVCNQGTAWSPGVQVALYLSLDAEIEGSFPAPGPDPWLANFFVPSLAPGDCHEPTAAGWADVPFDGAWHVGGIVDPYGSVPELIESNNAYTGGIVGVGYGADLVVTQLTGPASVPQGAGFFVGVEACNQGTAWSTPTELFLYHSEDEVIDPIFSGPPPADMMLANVSLPSLAPGGCYLQSKSVYAAVAATGFLAATVDEYLIVPELIETNNGLLGPALEITGP
jgi:subtilase family serine protease